MDEAKFTRSAGFDLLSRQLTAVVAAVAEVAAFGQGPERLAAE